MNSAKLCRHLFAFAKVYAKLNRKSGYRGKYAAAQTETEKRRPVQVFAEVSRSCPVGAPNTRRMPALSALN